MVHPRSFHLAERIYGHKKHKVSKIMLALLYFLIAGTLPSQIAGP